MITSSVRALGFVLATGMAVPAAFADDPPAPAEPAAVEPTIEKPADGGMQLHYTVETGIASTYVFRGLQQYNEKTDPSSMTTLALTFDKLGPGALTVGAWVALAIADRDAQPTTKTEIDLTATYAFPIGSLISGAAGYILYLYPDNEDPAHVDGAHEFWLSASVNDLPVTPTLAIFVDPIRLKGVYLQASVTRSFPAGPFTISPWAGLAFSKYDEEAFALAKDFGLNDFTATLPVKWAHDSGFYAQASVSYAYSGLIPDESEISPSTLYALLVAGFSK
jgi:hypothetical protein